MKTTVTSKMTEWKTNASNKLTEIRTDFTTKISRNTVLCVNTDGLT